MKKLDHENVIKLIEVINDEVTDKIYMGIYIFCILTKKSNGIC